MYEKVRHNNKIDKATILDILDIYEDKPFSYCNYGYHAFFTGGVIENQTQRMKIDDNEVNISTFFSFTKLTKVHFHLHLHRNVHHGRMTSAFTEIDRGLPRVYNLDKPLPAWNVVGTSCDSHGQSRALLGQVDPAHARSVEESYIVHYFSFLLHDAIFFSLFKMNVFNVFDANSNKIKQKCIQ